MELEDMENRFFVISYGGRTEMCENVCFCWGKAENDCFCYDSALVGCLACSARALLIPCGILCSPSSQTPRGRRDPVRVGRGRRSRERHQTICRSGRAPKRRVVLVREVSPKHKSHSHGLRGPGSRKEGYGSVTTCIPAMIDLALAR